MNKEERLQLADDLRTRWQKEGKLTEHRISFLDQLLALPDAPALSFAELFRSWEKEGVGHDLTDDECEALVLEIMADDE